MKHARLSARLGLLFLLWSCGGARAPIDPHTKTSPPQSVVSIPPPPNTASEPPIAASPVAPESRRRITATATLEPVVTRDVSSPTSGRISSVYVDVGTVVKTGNIMARIDPKTKVVAPIDGTVTARLVDPGQVAVVGKNGSSSALFTIASNLNVLRADAVVAESDASQLHIDMKAACTVDAQPGQTFLGIVRRIEKSADGDHVTIEIRNDDLKLRFGMTVNIVFDTGS